MSRMAILHRITTVFTLILLLISLAMPPAMARDTAVAVVSNPNPEDRLHLRSSPSKDGASLGRYYNGVIVVVIDNSKSTWWQVDVYGRKGYMEAKYLTPCGLESGYDQAVLDRVGDATPSAVVGGQRQQDRLHLRDRPSDKGNSYGKFHNGTPMQILGVIDNGSWYHVYLPDTHQHGFMLAKYVQVSGGIRPVGGSATPTNAPSAAGSAWAIVSNPLGTDRLHLRKTASANAASLGRFENGVTVEILSESAGWCQVNVDGKSGYMLAKYLLKDSALPPFVTLDAGRTINAKTPYQTLHSAPSPGASVVSVPNHEGDNALAILGKAGTWYFVEINGVKGYYPINRVMPGARSLGGNAAYAVVTGPNLRDRLHLRASTSETSKSLGLYPVGTQVEVLEYNVNGDASRDRMWSKVRVGGQTGYVRTRFLQEVRRGDPSTW